MLDPNFKAVDPVRLNHGFLKFMAQVAMVLKLKPMGMQKYTGLTQQHQRKLLPHVNQMDDVQVALANSARWDYGLHLNPVHVLDWVVHHQYSLLMLLGPSAAQSLPNGGTSGFLARRTICGIIVPMNTTLISKRGDPDSRCGRESGIWSRADRELLKAAGNCGCATRQCGVTKSRRTNALPFCIEATRRSTGAKRRWIGPLSGFRPLCEPGRTASWPGVLPEPGGLRKARPAFHTPPTECADHFDL